MSAKKFAMSTLILMVAALVVRALGFVYRVFLTNTIGAEGMGLYQLVTPVYSLIVLTITSGVSITSSRMISEKSHDMRNYKTVDRIVVVGIAFACVIGSVISFFIFIFASSIAEHLLGDIRTLPSIKLLMPCIPFVAAASGLRGYFYGIQRVGPAAFAQVCEQISRLFLVFLLASKVENMGIEYLCALAVGAAAFGELANFLVMLIAFPFYRRKKVIKSLRPHKSPSYIQTIKRMVKESSPISINRLVTSFTSAIEMIIIPQFLILGGMDYRVAMEQFGLLSGMAVPLLYFPSVITSSLSTSLVAEISNKMAVGEYNSVNNRISKSIFLTMVIGFLFSALFFALPDAIGDFVFPGMGVGEVLKMMSFSCVFLYLQMIFTGIMNGLGKQTAMLVNTLVGDSVRILFVIFLVPSCGVEGYTIGLFVSTITVCLLCFVAIARETGLRICIVEWFVKPMIAVFITFILCRANYVAFWSWFGELFGGRIATVFAIAVSAIQYLIILVFFKSNNYFFSRK